MPTHRILYVAAAAVVALGVGVVVYSNPPEEVLAQTSPPAPEPEQVKQPPVVLKGEAEPKKKVEAPVPDDHFIRLPDGSRAPVLNHAYGAPAMGWPPERPWSPITGKYTDPHTGEDWYMHQDGSRSSTVIRYHSHIGKMAPATNVFNPTKSVPMSPDAVAQFNEEMNKKARESAAGSRKD